MKGWAKLILLLPVLLAVSAEAATDTFATAGTFTWTAPDGATSVTVEAWGGGGAGGGATGTPAKGGGGAGGQYSKRVMTVVPGNTYAVVVGAGGAVGTGNGGAGGDSTFDGTAVVAKGGAGGTGVANGVAGLGSIVGGIGDVVYAGGNGADSTVDTNCNVGGGGGGGAGSTGAGGNAAGNTGGTGTAVGGGAGGTATTSSGNGAAGAAAGGGGAGACAESFTNRSGGAGGAGQVALSYVPAGGGVAVTVTASPTLCVNDNSIGTQSWGTLTGPFASDDAWATASVNDNQTTRYLKCTGYGFGIPDDAAVVGITVDVERNASNTLVSDFAMRIVKNGVIDTTVNYATTTNYTTADVIEAHGGAADLWGLPWTPADINSPDFGAALASRKNGASGGARTVRVDHMPITVDYTLPAPVAEYRMDEGSWNGTANEVADSSGNALHGSALLGATTAAAKICNGANLAANYAEVPDHGLLDITTALTVTAWIKPARWGGAPGDALMTILSKDANFEAHITGTGTINWWWGTGSITSAATAPIGAWTHVAMVYANGSQTLYINGVASATGTVAGALPTNALPFQIGNDQEFGGGTRRFDGMIDEVKIFNRALSPARVAAIYTNENAGNNWDGTVRTCPTYAPDHLEIQHASGTGLICAASTLTIKACTDATVPCVTPYTAGVGGTLSATGAGMTVNWDGTTGGAAGAGFVIPSGSSSVTKNVQVATAGSVVFGVASSAPVPTNGVTCNFGTPQCTFTASLAGFIFSDSTTSSTAYAIPSLTSGVAHNSTNLLWLRAVQASTANAAVCTPAIIGQTVSVDMGYACNNPNTCQAGTLANVNGTAIASAGTAIDLTFDANGSAAITSVRYDDAGEITLTASTTVTPFGGATPVTLSGSSNAFVAAPHHFAISGVTAAPIKAGTNFAATVTAYNGLATPTVTANFGKEAIPASVTMSFTKCQPTYTGTPPDTYTSNGTFSGSLGAFTGGAANAADLNWNEVGNGDLVATSSDYLGSGLSPTGNTGTAGTTCNGAGGAGNVGRFIPDHFDTVVTGPLACPAGLICPLGGLAYSGQAFTANVYARSAGGTVTQNYDGTANTSPNFAKAVTLAAWDALGSTTTQNPPAGTGALGSNSIAASAFSMGSTASGTPGAPTYTFAATPTNPTDVYIRAVDTDNVTSLRVPSGASIEGGVKVVSGRVKLSNAHGSELLPLSITATAQYYGVAGWVTSVTDSVSQFNTNLSTAGGNVSASIVHGPLASGDLSVVAPGLVTFASGTRTFRLGAPAVVGSADLTITAPSYLVPGTAGRITFGVYKGSNEFIYMREQ